ncbi:cytochrome b/b6 domain-containing protein [Photobacterium sp. SKA34]|uniref:cytochrome b/b6 domain-containing protein n=1 Tax=Photobacterium sp. SKA34 TaxID=121723 RepID=UPI0009FF934B
MRPYNSIQITLHWLTLILILSTYTSMAMIKFIHISPAMFGFLYKLHMTTGISVGVIFAARLYLRISRLVKYRDQPTEKKELLTIKRP